MPFWRTLGNAKLGEGRWEGLKTERVVRRRMLHGGRTGFEFAHLARADCLRRRRQPKAQAVMRLLCRCAVGWGGGCTAGRMRSRGTRRLQGAEAVANLGFWRRDCEGWAVETLMRRTVYGPAPAQILVTCATASITAVCRFQHASRNRVRGAKCGHINALGLLICLHGKPSSETVSTSSRYPHKSEKCAWTSLIDGTHHVSSAHPPRRLSRSVFSPARGRPPPSPPTPTTR